MMMVEESKGKYLKPELHSDVTELILSLPSSNYIAETFRSRICPDHAQIKGILKTTFVTQGKNVALSRARKC
jgi:hypothetical protein